MPVFFTPKLPISYDKYSVITANFPASASMGIIGIYVLEQSRVIYIESGIDASRSIILHQIELPKPAHSDSEVQMRWTSENLPISNLNSIADTIQGLRRKARVFKEIQVNQTDFQKFKHEMYLTVAASDMVLGDQDNQIQEALTSINQSINFSNSVCSII